MIDFPLYATLALFAAGCVGLGVFVVYLTIGNIVAACGAVVVTINAVRILAWLKGCRP